MARLANSRRVAVLLAGLLLGATSGCVRMSSVTLARTSPRGTVQLGVTPVSLLGVGLFSSCSSVSGCTETALTVQAEVAVRGSPHDRVELGLRGFISGGAFDVKVGLVRPRNPFWGFNLSVDPEFAVGAFGQGTGPQVVAGSGVPGVPGAMVASVSLPVLMGFEIAGSEFILAPRFTDYQYFGGTNDGAVIRSLSSPIAAHGNIATVGLSIGYAILAARGFWIVPMTSAAFPVFADRYGQDQMGNAPLSAQPTFQVDLGFIVDVRHRSRRLLPDEAR